MPGSSIVCFISAVIVRSCLHRLLRQHILWYEAWFDAALFVIITAIVAFVTPRGHIKAGATLQKDLKGHVSKEIGAIARPADIRFTQALPKTRSGKIMRRLLRNIASGEKPKGDTSTLEDYSVLASLSESDEN